MTQPKTWTCEVCKKPILNLNGCIELFHANPANGYVGGYPHMASPDFPDDEFTDAKAIERDPDIATRDEIAFSQVQDAHWLLDRPMNVGMRSVHYTCSTYEGCYCIDLGRAANAEAWIRWCLHVSEKTWIGKWDLERLLSFWVGDSDRSV
jgi:hypothetical protein